MKLNNILIVDVDRGTVCFYLTGLTYSLTVGKRIFLKFWHLVFGCDEQSSEKNLKSGISKDNDNEIYRFPFCNMIQTLFT